MSEEDKPSQNGNGNGNGKKGYKEFTALFGKERKVAIFSHRCPDPDAIASMMGIAWLVERVFGATTQMFYGGEISHPQNVSMINLMSPSLTRAAEYDDAVEEQSEKDGTKCPQGLSRAPRIAQFVKLEVGEHA